MNLKKTVKVLLYGSSDEADTLYRRIEQRFDEMVSSTHTHLRQRIRDDADDNK